MKIIDILCTNILTIRFYKEYEIQKATNVNLLSLVLHVHTSWWILRYTLLYSELAVGGLS